MSSNLLMQHYKSIVDVEDFRDVFNDPIIIYIVDF